MQTHEYQSYIQIKTMKKNYGKSSSLKLTLYQMQDHSSSQQI